MKIGDLVLSPNSSIVIDPDRDASIGKVAYRIESISPLKVTEVRFYTSFGWLSHDELFDLRQEDPRNAP